MHGAGDAAAVPAASAASPKLTAQHVAVYTQLRSVPLVNQRAALSYRGRALAGSGLTDILTSVAAWPVRTLDLSSTQLGDAGALLLAEVLAVHSTLEELDVAKNGIRDGGGSALGIALAQNTRLHTLRVAWNAFGDDALVRGFAPGLAANRTLTHLDLHCCKFGGAGMAALMLAATAGRRLRVLEVRQNKFGNEGARAMAEALAAGVPLTSLDCGDCGITAPGVATLAHGLEHAPRPTVETIELQGSVLDEQAGTRLGLALRVHDSARMLSFDRSDVSGAAVAALLAAAFDAPERPQPEPGASRVFEALPRASVDELRGSQGDQCALSELHLGRTQLGDADVDLLAWPLQFACTIETLDLESNRITDTGLVALVSATNAVDALETCDLSGNRVRGPGGTRPEDAGPRAALQAALAAALSSAPSSRTTSFDLTRNAIDVDTCRMIAALSTPHLAFVVPVDSVVDAEEITRRREIVAGKAPDAAAPAPPPPAASVAAAVQSAPTALRARASRPRRPAEPAATASDAPAPAPRVPASPRIQLQPCLAKKVAAAAAAAAAAQPSDSFASPPVSSNTAAAPAPATGSPVARRVVPPRAATNGAGRTPSGSVASSPASPGSPAAPRRADSSDLPAVRAGPKAAAKAARAPDTSPSSSTASPATPPSPARRGVSRSAELSPPVVPRRRGGSPVVTDELDSLPVVESPAPLRAAPLPPIASSDSAGVGSTSPASAPAVLSPARDLRRAVLGGGAPAPARARVRVPAVAGGARA